jgi:hypothetical protein
MFNNSTVACFSAHFTASYDFLGIFRLVEATPNVPEPGFCATVTLGTWHTW